MQVLELARQIFFDTTRQKSPETALVESQYYGSPNVIISIRVFVVLTLSYLAQFC